MINKEIAIFAGGCFWCMEAAFSSIEGVLKTVSGYIGGSIENPTYEQVSSGNTGHYEALEITYDANIVSYKKLLNIFWCNIDPLDKGGQFADRGNQYFTAIFYLNEQQRLQAEQSKKHIAQCLGSDIETKIMPANLFYPAEDYHQQYYKNNHVRYEFYKKASGRVQRLKELWKE
jgi:methionine-S-sulfoxide reductase